MCFSATASFGVAGALAIAGGVTLSRARFGREMPLASLPLLFACHQAIEGVLWLGFSSGEADGLRPLLVHSFLLFAFVILPPLVPIAAYLVEPPGWRRRAMVFFILWCSAVAIALLALMFLSPYEATIAHGNIRYRNSLDVWGIEYFYAIGVTAPLLLSTHPMLNVLGVLAGVLFAITKVLLPETYVSVWCFLAAVSSAVILVHFLGKRSRLRSEGRTRSSN